MTKVDVSFKLSRELSDAELKQIARIHAVYGMFAARLKGAGDELFVEYDASRLSPKEVRATLERHAIPIT